jgi:peptidoglycan/xylan/chitin deacetylase (PgdA/CDA1 family)
MTDPTRRRFLKSAATAAMVSTVAERSVSQAHARAPMAQVAITLDLEMSREFPTRDQMHWDFEKGNLNEATKRYALEAARRVKARGGLIHFFGLGRTMEQADVSWLQEIVDAGHPLGNHTYDHVYLLASKPQDLQFRFARAPWLLEGRDIPAELRRNIELAERAFEARLKGRSGRSGGFRTPGGFATGLKGREDLQKMLLDMGYTWVSSLYPAHSTSKPGERPSEEVFRAIEDAQEQAQPFVYPTGLVEIPMSPISDIGALRTGRWPLADFKEAIRRSLVRCIERGFVFDFLAHPSCLGVVDPNFETIDVILDTVEAHKDKARIVTLGEIAVAASARQPQSK